MEMRDFCDENWDKTLMMMNNRSNRCMQNRSFGDDLARKASYFVTFLSSIMNLKECCKSFSSFLGFNSYF